MQAELGWLVGDLQARLAEDEVEPAGKKTGGAGRGGGFGG